MGQPLWHR
ncbi:hypothetical protein YPPY45_2753, partial [Yersinia pestis PY-45]